MSFHVGWRVLSGVSAGCKTITVWGGYRSFMSCVHIRCRVHGFYWLRFYSASLSKSAKVTKALLPHHLAPRWCSVYPPADPEPWAAATGHPWPNAANPASCRVAHGSESAGGHRGLTGRHRSKSKTRRPDSRPDCVNFPGFCRSCRRLRSGVSDDVFVGCADVSRTSSLLPVRGETAAFDLLLILGAPLNHAGRNSILLCGANRQGCRFSRLRPWMAGGGGPTQQCRITGMPSDSEAPSGGARAFCLLLRCSKVRRCKSATNISRHPNNGYVHKNHYTEHTA